MNRDPDLRYQTAEALATDLRAFLDDRPTSVDGRRPWLVFGLLMKRHRAIVGAAAMLGGMLVVFAALVTALEIRRQGLAQEVTVAEERLVQAEAEAGAAEQVKDEAEASRDQALDERNQALDQRTAALAARDRAKQGQTEAEARAAEEIEARILAESERIEALAHKLEAEAELERESALRGELLDALREAEERYIESRTRADMLEVLLEDEVVQRRQTERDRDLALQDLLDLQRQIADIEIELELLRTAAEAPPAEVAPWMDDPTAASAATPSPEGAPAVSQTPP